jgi:hypothetical protein
MIRDPRRLYRRLLRLAPAPLRARHAGHMEEASYSYDAIGRLEPGGTVEQAEQDLLRGPGRGLGPAPLVFGAAAAILCAGALAANWIPVRRATRTDPVTSLRL